MRLVTFVQGQGAAMRAGVLLDEDQRVLDLRAAWDALYPGTAAPAAVCSVLELVEGGDEALALVRELVATRQRTGVAVLPRAGVSLRAPIPRPPQMRDFLCFEKHLLQAYTALRRIRAAKTPDPEAAMAEMDAKGILQMPQAWYERPYFYHPNRLNVIGHEQDVRWPWYCEEMDFELEFGLVIGKPTLEVPRERALEQVFGYTIFNDVSARDEQSRESPGTLGPGKGKDFDTGNILGPCLVTADEVGNPYDLTMIARVNGEEWARGSTRDMHWKWEDCIAHVARSETLVPGEVLGSGTVGDGCGLEHMRFLKPGDVVELEIERIGVLRNRFVRGPVPSQT
jgi:2-keto-4-pentenoate hydratase/2-oxohepta-3-ene-1,7-dioic acid hydratase in catechol pathway